ncbi:TetR/AcrR family transcriptional regulator [Alsobacter sp. R-9]
MSQGDVIPPRVPSRSGGTRSGRDPERTSAAILAAAIEEFSENGYGGARIDAIAERAGVNKRMLYHYFGDKDALYERVLQEIYRGIRSAEQRLNLRGRDPIEAIRELCHFTWRYFLDHPEFLSLLATENMNKARVLKQASWAPSVNSPIVGELSEVLRRGAETGVFRPGLDAVDVYVTMAGVGWFSLCNRYTLSVSFNRDFLDRRHLARWGDHMADVVLAWLKP